MGRAGPKILLTKWAGLGLKFSGLGRKLLAPLRPVL